MADRSQTSPSSVFDGMLARTKQQFDTLYHGSKGGLAEPAQPAAAIFGHEKLTRPASAAEVDDGSAAARRLRARFGNDWHFEVRERHRDGDEAIVLGRLTFGKERAVRAQFGRAKFRGASVAGATSGVRFRLGEGSGARDEQEAFDRAAEASLTNCVDLI